MDKGICTIMIALAPAFLVVCLSESSGETNHAHMHQHPLYWIPMRPFVWPCVSRDASLRDASLEKTSDHVSNAVFSPLYYRMICRSTLPGIDRRVILSLPGHQKRHHGPHTCGDPTGGGWASLNGIHGTAVVLPYLPTEWDLSSFLSEQPSICVCWHTESGRCILKLAVGLFFFLWLFSQHQCHLFHWWYMVITTITSISSFM